MVKSIKVMRRTQLSWLSTSTASLLICLQRRRNILQYSFIFPVIPRQSLITEVDVSTCHPRHSVIERLYVHDVQICVSRIEVLIEGQPYCSAWGRVFRWTGN